MTSKNIAPNSVRADGRIVLESSSKDSWSFRPVILDSKTGIAEEIPLAFTGEVFIPGWTRDGQIIASGVPFKSEIWRFRPTPATMK